MKIKLHYFDLESPECVSPPAKVALSAPCIYRPAQAHRWYPFLPTVLPDPMPIWSIQLFPPFGLRSMDREFHPLLIFEFFFLFKNSRPRQDSWARATNEWWTLILTPVHLSFEKKKEKKQPENFHFLHPFFQLGEKRVCPTDRRYERSFLPLRTFFFISIFKCKEK